MMAPFGTKVGFNKDDNTEDDSDVDEEEGRCRLNEEGRTCDPLILLNTILILFPFDNPTSCLHTTHNSSYHHLSSYTVPP